MKKINTKAQGVFGMSFGVIFSIILIVFILVVAGIAITKFLGLKRCAQVGMFIDDLQNDIDDAWNSQKFNDDASFILPGNLDYVCFADLSKERVGGEIEKMIYSDIGVYEREEANMFFYPRQKACNMAFTEIKHINVDNIISSRNPKCFEVEGGKVSIEIDKGFDEALVTLR